MLAQSFVSHCKYWNMDTIWSQLKATANYDARLQAVNEFNANNKWKKKGLAIVPLRWAAGYAGDHQNSLVSIYGDGTVTVYHSGVEIGQGIDTKGIAINSRFSNAQLPKRLRTS